MTPPSSGTSILDDSRSDERGEILGLLEQAYWMEIETVMSYIANSINPDGVRAQEIVRSLQADIQEELGHAMQFANRIKELYASCPAQCSSQPSRATCNRRSRRPTSCR